MSRVLKPGGRLLIVGEAYKGGKIDDRNKKWAELCNMVYLNVDEFRELFQTSGYSDVQVF